MPRKRCAMLRALVALKVVVIGTLCVVVARRRAFALLASPSDLASLKSGVLDPAALGYRSAVRSSGSPDAGAWVHHVGARPLPTNAWWQNLVLGESSDETSLAYALPFVVDTYAGDGVRYSASRIVAGDSMVQVAHDMRSGVFLGAAEALGDRVVEGFGSLGVGLRWDHGGGSVYAPIARGAPFGTMSYRASTPVISSQAPLHRSSAVEADGAEVDCDGSRFEVVARRGTSVRRWPPSKALTSRSFPTHFG